MSDKTPRDEFDALNSLDFPGAEPEDLTEEERSFTFDEDYLDREPSPPESGKEDGKARTAGQEEALLAAFRTLSGKEEKPAPGGEPSPEPPAKEKEPPSPEKKPDKEKATAEQEEAVFAAFSQMVRREEKDASPTGEEASETAPASPAPEPEEKKTELAPAPAARPTRRPNKEQRQAMARRVREPDPVTIGKSLKPNQMLVYDSELDEVDYTDDDDLPEARDYLPIRFRRYGRLGIGGGILYALFVISVSIILACLAWMFASDVLALNKEPASAIVTIEEYVPEGDDAVYTIIDGEEVPIQVDIDQVTQALKGAGMIEYEWLFKLFSRFSHAETKIDPGTYDVSTELDYRALVTALQFGSGNQEITRITFPEGLTMDQIFELLEENHICHKDELYEAAANYDFDYDFLPESTLGDANRLEGYLFPDTYDFYEGEAASVAINRFLQNLNNRVTDDMLSAAANRGWDMHELLTMASLIEKEAGSTEEMPTIASVMYNRLNAGMNLQLDTTINYIKGTSTLNITIEDTEIDDPYNTYLYGGLPPGPICCPGLAAIEAVIEPESTDYWYWYAYNGENHFFTNFDEFDVYSSEHPNTD